MLRQEHHPWSVKLFSKGANTDMDADLFGKQGEGMYRDARNFRPTSIVGATGVLEKIGGETLIYPPTDPNASSYTCMGSCEVQGRNFSIWVAPNLPTIITIDGVVMVQSEDIPYDILHPMQLAVNRDCRSGLVCPLDYNSVPLIWDVADIMANYQGGTGVYFDPLFNPNLYYINTTAPLDQPVHIGLRDVGVGGGLPVGQYSYSIRYVNDAGDRTNWGPETPLISVPRFQDAQIVSASRIHPGAMLTGEQAAPDTRTRYAIELEFRVNNEANYNAIEIRRVQHNAGVGIESPGEPFVVARIPISPGQFSIVQWTDPADADQQTTIPDDEEEIQQFFIKKARTGRFIDNRLVLMNVEVEDKQPDLTFREVNGLKMVPVTKDLGTLGHTNSVQNTYFKRYMSGERYGFAVQLYDGQGGKSFAIPIPGYENFKMPDRRTAKAGDSLTFSDAPVYAANDQGAVSATFEAYEQGSRSKDLPTPTYIWQTFGSTFAPLRPTGVADAANVDGHRTIVNDRVEPGSGGVDLPYSPQGFAPKFHTQGMALYGITNIPVWAKGFSVVRTDPAGRVACQGILTYGMTQGGSTPTTPASKLPSIVAFHSPDIDSGYVGQQFVDDIIANPQDYAVEIQAPVGFFSEVYNYKGKTYPGFFGNFGVNIDMISYARIQWDQGQINPGMNTSGLQPTGGIPGGNYVNFGQWRNAGQNNPLFSGGTISVPLSSAGILSQSGGGQYLQLQLAQNLYLNTSGATGFANAQNFHEPWYIANIVRTGANVQQQTSQTYKNTGAYVKVEGLIGISDGTSGQQFRLVDERLDDVRPNTVSELRYIWVQEPGGTSQPYLNINLILTQNPTLLAQISADINNNGLYTDARGNDVVGLFTTGTDQNGRPVVQVGGSYTPGVGARIYVRYDPLAPVKVFGGDSTITQGLMPRFNKLARVVGTSSNDDIGNPTSSDEVFYLGSCAWPYSSFRKASNYQVSRSPGTAESVTAAQLHGIRQLVILYDAEARTPTILSDDPEGDTINRAFPRVHYIMRPNSWDQSAGNAQQAGVSAQYDVEYPNEFGSWGRGGFRCGPLVNLDYAAKPLAYGVSAPESYTQVLEFCNGVLWSPKVSPLDQDSPGYKTFPSLNFYLTEESQGAIMRAFSAQARNGHNLYAVCKSGTAELLTSKSIAYSANGETVAQFISDNFIGAEVWLSRNIGMPGETWRGSAEGPIPAGGGYADALFWFDRKGVYRMVQSGIDDIARGRYLSGMLPFLKVAAQGGPLTSVVNTRHNEVWFLIGKDRVEAGQEDVEKALFVFNTNPEVNNWTGRYDYRFDQFLCIGQDIYGMRDLRTFLLDDGFEINGENITAHVDVVHAPNMGMRTEFIRVRYITSSDAKRPTRVEFYDPNGTLATYTDEALNGALYLRYVDGWENFVGRRTDTKLRLQETHIVERIIHSVAETFKLVNSQMQHKSIK